jgi:transposase
MATSPLFDANTSISKDLRNEIILRLTRVEFIKDIADDLGISASTVQRTVQSLADQITKPSRDYLPQNLCIDEFKSMRSVSGKMSFIAVDGDRHELFEILEDWSLYKLFNHYQFFS